MLGLEPGWFGSQMSLMDAVVSPVWVWRLAGHDQGDKESGGLQIPQEPACSLALSLAASMACGRWAQNIHSYPQLEPLPQPRVGAKGHRVARPCFPEARLCRPLLGPAHITHLRLGTQEGVRALGDLRAPIKPSQPSHKKSVIFDDLKGLVPEREWRWGGGGGREEERHLRKQRGR